jgi:hypothetical protein
MDAKMIVLDLPGLSGLNPAFIERAVAASKDHSLIGPLLKEALSPSDLEALRASLGGTKNSTAAGEIYELAAKLRTVANKLEG